MAGPLAGIAQQHSAPLSNPSQLGQQVAKPDQQKPDKDRVREQGAPTESQNAQTAHNRNSDETKEARVESSSSRKDAPTRGGTVDIFV